MLQITISEELKKQLKQEAREKGLSLASYVRMILILRNQEE